MVSTFDCAFSPELPPELESGEVGVLLAAPLAAEEDEWVTPQKKTKSSGSVEERRA